MVKKTLGIKRAQPAQPKPRKRRNTARKPKWTVMVFMGADNLPEEKSLGTEANDDIEEMKIVGSSSSVNIFTQLHGKGFVERRHIGKGKPVSVPVDEQDATDGKALIAFIEWALKKAKHQKDDYSMLVLWGHAYRFGIGRAETRSGVDALDFAELADVLTDFQERHRHTYWSEYHEDIPKLDIVAFDACELATIEMAYQLYPFADYLVASQIAIPLPGWPYHRILDRLKNGVPRMTPVELGSFIVRQFCAHYFEENTGKNAPQAVSLTLLDLSRAEQVFEATEALAQSLAIAVEDLDQEELVSTLFQQSQAAEDKPFIDVADLCLNLSRFTTDPDVDEASRSLGDLLIRPVTPPSSRNGNGDATPRPFIVEHGRSGHSTARLHGVSLFAPHVGPDDLETASELYEKLVFAQRTVWRDLVLGFAQQT